MHPVTTYLTGLDAPLREVGEQRAYERGTR